MDHSEVRQLYLLYLVQSVHKLLSVLLRVHLGRVELADSVLELLGVDDEEPAVRLRLQLAAVHPGRPEVGLGHPPGPVLPGHLHHLPLLHLVVEDALVDEEHLGLAGDLALGEHHVPGRQCLDGDGLVAHFNHHLLVNLTVTPHEVVSCQHRFVKLKVQLCPQWIRHELQELHVPLVREVLLLLEAVLSVPLHAQREIGGDLVLFQVPPQCADLLLEGAGQDVEPCEGRCEA
mmetsp:Transcript_54817/g.123428  ORF Transcript_54817/g.123428 Transcript_54817/m.123428 type:complete len:232 (+) Transcript_54817:224-919(+)